MVKGCSAVGCSNYQGKSYCKEAKVSFHRFPLKNKELLRTWYDKIRRHNFVATKYNLICSEHFEEGEFEYQLFTGRRQLKKLAVPTRFSQTPASSRWKRTSHEFEKKLHSETMDELKSNFTEELRKVIKQESQELDDPIYSTHYSIKQNTDLYKGSDVLYKTKDQFEDYNMDPKLFYGKKSSAFVVREIPSESKGAVRKRGRPSMKVERLIEIKKQRSAKTVAPPQRVRTDNVGHWPVYGEKRGRCKFPTCTGYTWLLCEKCKVQLCLTKASNCFKNFHAP